MLSHQIATYPLQFKISFSAHLVDLYLLLLMLSHEIASIPTSVKISFNAYLYPLQFKISFSDIYTSCCCHIRLP